jgi:hypothetical protein
MIIHNPEITGSLSFPRTDGTKVIIQLSSQGGLETVIADATGSVTGTPQSNFSGSFTGSFIGDGSQITGVAASSLNIDLFTAGTIVGDDEILFSDTDDNGTEKRGTFKGGLDSVGVISGSIQVDVEQTTNFTSFSSSIASTFAGLTSEFNDISNNPFSQSASSVTVSKSIIPTTTAIDLGSAAVPFRDLYLSSASLYINGTQVLSTDAQDLTLTTDTNQSLRLVETGVDTITLQTENGDITLTATGTGNIELDAPVQILAGNKIISSDGNAIVFGENIDIEGDITLDGTVDGVDVSQLNSDFNTLKGKTLVSGSSQISLSGFSTTDLSEGTNLYYTDVRVKTKLDTEGVISGSSQVTSLAHLDTDDLSEGGNLYYTDARVKTKLDTEGVISGSSQVSLSTTDVSEGTNLYYTDVRVKTKLDAETVVSGSSQILTLVSIDEDNMASNSDTKLPTQQSVKSYVDAQVSGLVDSAPGTLDTLNELAAALGDDANFSTTISTTIGGKVSQSLQIISGDGLTGGGNLTTNRTLNVVGTTDRISVTADAVDIASTYVGQSSITTLGTIGTGTWQGTAIASAYLDADTAHLTGTQTFSGAKTFSAAVSVTDSTASTSKTTGALKVTGGISTQGDLFAGGDVVAFASSDERLKKNIEIISNPIQKVQSLKGVTWNWKDEASEAQKATPALGVIAQDVEKVLPQLVDTRDNGYKAVDYGKLTGLLIEAIKEQQKQIDELKSRLQ